VRNNITLLVGGYKVPTRTALIPLAQEDVMTMASSDQQHMFQLLKLFLFHTADLEVVKRAFVAAVRCNNVRAAEYIMRTKLVLHLPAQVRHPCTDACRILAF